MIKSIKLKSGSSPGHEPLQFELTPITVFVGPNNSGKSKVLMEIETQATQATRNPSSLILDALTYLPIPLEELELDIKRLKEPFLAESTHETLVYMGKLDIKTNSIKKIYIQEIDLIKGSQSQSSNNSAFSSYISLYTLRLDGANRLSLLLEQSAGDLLRIPINHLSYLFLNNEIREEVRRIVFDAFGKYYVIDPTKIGTLRVRLSINPPICESEEKGWDQNSINFHRNAVLIDETSDGVKAFTGIITALLAGEPKITLIDEPEAFLHPALSNKLGKEIGTLLRRSTKRLFVSTHSSSFLMGCIQSGAPLNIIRLTYNNGIATSRLLPQEKILHLMRNPLLRSTGVLNGLFYESVIVTEADSDRAFYQEINDRLLSANDPRGISNCLFINAQNKQTVWDIVSPLRDLGIPAIGIVDIDVLKEGGAVFSKLLYGCNIPSLSHNSFTLQRKAILDALNATDQKWKREGGISVLDKESKDSANGFFDQLKDYGAFVVRYGELEYWLKEYGAVGHGPIWLLNIFELMGENPDDNNYLKPTEGNIWDFIGELKQWVINNNRKGIPS
jgi:hypothetical protein